MFADSYRKLSRTCYGESTPYALQKSSVLRWLQKHVTCAIRRDRYSKSQVAVEILSGAKYS